MLHDPNLRTVSGMRPTGPLHLGHYFGALKNWVPMQKEGQAFFFVADLHALTSDFADTSKIKGFVNDLVVDWLASGLDPEKAIIYQQSRVTAISELSLLLGMITPVSWLMRNPTYKEQQQEITNKDLENFGFLGYPVMMAADILLFRPKWVPVGQDQLPHLELTREIARRFNHFYGQTFPEPEAKLTPTAKCPGLDGRKMSKSYGNSIYLKDTMEEITPKVKGMFTDPARVRRTDPGNPEVCNLFPYHELLTDAAVQAEIRQGCTQGTLGCVDCKKIFLTGLEKFLKPLHEKRAYYAAKPELIKDILALGNIQARTEAALTMQAVQEAMHLA